MSPLFLSLDGLDGTGKTTQCRLLAEWLRGRGHEVTQCADPGGTPVGTELRGILLGHRHDVTLRAEALLFMAGRAELTDCVIKPALAAGHDVVSDRYSLANIAYQGHAGGLDVATLWRLEQFATSGLEPHLTLVLDLPVDVAIVRRGRIADRKELAGRRYHEQVRRGFLTEAAARPDRILVIDASPSAEDVQAAIRAAIEPFLAGG